MQYNIEIIEKLKKKFGLPLYVFDRSLFEENYKELENTFKTIYPNYCISYSYKTNYTPYVCNLIKQLGGYAEVVSSMEYKIAKKLGYEAEKIIFNGPDKGVDGLTAIDEGCIVNVDNISELEGVITFANRNPEKEYRIGLRVNMNVGQNFVSRFGMDKKDIAKAFHLVSKVSNLKIVGLHCHISRCRDLEAWKKRTEIMLAVADQFFEEVPTYIDLGSGMYGKMHPAFASQFENVPSYEEYAKVTAKHVAEHYQTIPDDKKPLLFTEPGTTLINKYIDLVGEVDAIKSINDKCFAVLNCSEHNLGETCLLKKLPIEVFHSNDAVEEYKNLDFTGYTCLEQDVMYTNYSGRLAIGDYVVFGNVGGYSNVYKPPFIKPNCAMISCEPNGEYKLIKKVESVEDILRTYIF